MTLNPQDGSIVNVATSTDLMNRVRLELGDQATTFDIALSGDGSSTRFETNMYPLDSTSLVISVNGVAQTSANVTVEERTGVLTFSTAPALNAVIRFAGTRYRFFGYTDLKMFLDAAVGEHLYHRTDAFGRAMTMANLPVIEEYPVSILAAYMALTALATDASFDIDISAPDGVSIPRSERYRQLLDMMATRQQQYKDLCAALNIGLNRIEVFNLRRVSRTTNKLVPIYIAQEIDDYSKPQRVYLPTNTYGADALPSKAAQYDLVLRQGDSFSNTVDFDFDITNYTITAQIRQFAESPVIAAVIAINVVNATQGTIALSLTADQTRFLPLLAVWDLQVKNNLNAQDVRTFLQGKVFTQRDVTRDGNYLAQTAPGIYPPLLGGDAQEGFTALTTYDGTGRGI